MCPQTIKRNLKRARKWSCSTRPTTLRLAFLLLGVPTILYIYTGRWSRHSHLKMNIRHSPEAAEAAALARYVYATRAVSVAFDATRGEPELGVQGGAVALAMQRLDAALLELDTSRRSLDAILSRAGGH